MGGHEWPPRRDAQRRRQRAMPTSGGASNPQLFETALPVEWGTAAGKEFHCHTP